MEGLEISVVKLSEVIKSSYSSRWDSFYFQKEFLKDEKIFETWASLENIAIIKSGTTPKDRDETLKTGVVLLKTNDIRNNILLDKGNDYFYISEAVNNEMISSQVASNDILINIVGATTEVVGRVSFVPQNFKKANITQAMSFIRLTDSKYSPFFVFIFLQTKYGLKQTRRIARPTGQYNINNIELGSYKVPSVSDTFQSKIESLVKSAHAKLEESKSLYSQAEDLLLGELGLKDWQAKNTLHTTKKFSDFAQSGRLDAEYYQPKYDDLFEKLSCLNCKRLGKIVSIKKSFDPGSDAYQETGIPFIRVSDISKDGIEKTELHLSPIDFDIPELKPKKDTILFSKDGSIGIAYKVQSDLNVFTSGALLHLVTTDSSILPDYLTLVLNSVVVKLQAERDSNGAIIQHWKPSDIENVIIPILPEQIQKKIASLIQQSFECKAQSKQLLEDAKRMVESEIEKN